MKKPLDYTLTIAVILAFCSQLTNCVTEKRRLKICKSCALKVERRDSIITKEVIRNVPYAVPGPSISVQIPNPCADLCDSLGRLKSGFKRQTHTQAGTATIFTRGDSLYVRCEADSLKGVIQAKDHIIESYQMALQQVPARCEREHLTKWDSFLIVCGKIFGLLLFVITLGLFIRWRLKP